MKRKYYMRGLGLGVLITAILCAVALPKKTEPMTDEQVVARAKELGYVKAEGGVTADDINKIKENEKGTGTPAVSDAPENTPDVTEEPEGTPGPTQSPVPTPDAPEPPDEPDKPEHPTTPTPKVTATPKPTSATTPKATATPKPIATTPLKTTSTPVPTKAPEVTDGHEKTIYTVKIERGATARRVAEQLESVGAVENAEAFVKYLQSRNLTDFINIGTFSIPQGASHAEITRILTDR